MPYLSLPDGTSMEVPKGLSETQALDLAKKQFPEAFPEEYAKHKEKTGFFPAVKSSFKEGAGSALEGVGNLVGSEDVAGYGKKIKEEAAGQYEPTTSQDIDVAKRQGITSLLGTGLSKYITEPVGQAVGSVAGRYGAPTAAGAAASFLAPEAALAGAAGFAAANFPIHFGENITAQKEAGQQPDYGKALVPAMVQTAVDSLAPRLVGGAMKGIALKTATEEAQLLAPKVLSGELTAQQATAQLSGRLSSVLKGTVEAAGAGTLMSTVGTAGQKFAADQDVFNEEALNQYIEGAKQMGLVAPFFGLLRAGQPARAKKLIDDADTKVKAEQQAKVDAEQKAYYQSPEGQAQLQAEREPIIQQIKDLREVLKSKGLPKEEKDAGKEQLNALQKQLDSIHEKLGIAPALEEGQAPQTVEGRLAALKAQREQTAQAEQEKQRQDAAAQEERLQKARAGLELGEAAPKAVALKNLPDNLTVREKEAQAKELEDHRSMLANSIPRMENMLNGIQSQLDSALEKGDTQTYRNLINDRAQISDALDAAKKQQAALPKAPEEERASLEKEVEKLKREAAKYTGPAFDQEKVDKIVGKLETAQKRLGELPKAEEKNLFAPKQQGLAFEETSEEKAYAAKQKELEGAFGNTDEHLVGRLVDTVNAQGKEEPTTNLRVARLQRAIEEAKANGDEKSEAALYDRLDDLQEQLNLRPEDARNKALLDQQEAIDNLRDAVEDVKTGRYLGEGTTDTSTAESMKSGLIDKAKGHVAQYIEAAIRDINARRAALKQKPLSVDESLKLAYDLKDSLDKVISNQNLSVLLRPDYMQQRLKLKGATSGEEAAALKKLSAQYTKSRKEGALAEGVSQIEKQLAGIKQKYAEGEFLVKGEKQFFSSMERDPAQMLKSELEKKNPNLEKVKALRNEVRKLQEQEKLAEEEKARQEAVDMERYAPSGVNPDQYSLFGAKELEPIATVRATPANFMKFVGIQRNKLQHSIKMAQAALEKVKAKGTSAAEDRARIEAEQARKGPLVERLAGRLEDSFAKNKEEAISRSAQLRNLFSTQLEYKLLFDIAQTKEKIKQYEEIAAGEKGKFKEGYKKYVKELEKTIAQAEKYLEDIRARDVEYFTIEGENNKRSVQMTRKVLKNALAENKITEEQAAPVSREIDRIEATNQAELQKRVTEKRLAEQKALEASASAEKVVPVKEEVGALIIDKKKLDRISKRLKANEAKFDRMNPESKGYDELNNKIEADKEAIDRLKESIFRTKSEKQKPLTEEEKRAKLYEESAEGAKEMQAIRKQLGLDKPNRKDVIADSKAYIKALEERIEANDKKRRVASPRSDARKKFENVVSVLTKELENEKEILAEQQKLAKAERALAVAGNEPGRKQKLKPLTKGTANPAKDFAEGLASERGYEPDYSPRIDRDEKGSFIFRSGKSEGVFRKGFGEGGVDLAETAKRAEEFKNSLPEGVKFEYADTPDALPDYVKNQLSEKSLNAMQGAVLPDGTIVAVGNKHVSMLDFEKTLAHEAIGHYGIERILGKENLVNLITRIDAQKGGFYKLANEMGVLKDILQDIKDEREARGPLTPQQEKMIAVREMLARFEEKRLDDKTFMQKASRFIKELIGVMRDWIRKSGFAELKTFTDADMLNLLKQSREAMEGKRAFKYTPLDEDTAFRKAKFSDESDPLAQLSSKLVAKPKGIKDSLKGNLAAFNTQFIDRLAPLKEIWRRMGETGPASQMMYNLLAHGQRNNISSETVVNGARKFYKDPTTGEVTIRSAGGPGMKQVLQELLQSDKGNPQALNEMFTAYAAAKRAEIVGYRKLIADGEISASITPKMLEEAKKSGNADPAFVKAFDTYQKYNNGLIDSLADSGYIAKEKATELKNKNYIPYYRSRGGVVDLVIGSETPIRIGTLKDQPYLHELVGGDQKIQDFFKSSVQNTNMITEMALRNNATASVANVLQNLGIAEIRKGEGEARPDVIRFKSNGKDYHAVIDTSKNAEFSDIDPNLLVKGMEGIPTQLPGIVRLMGVPASWLRKGVTRNPFYAYKQLVRDPMSAWLTTGADFTPILSSLKEVNNAVRGAGETNKHLQESGILGGEVYTGRAEDLNQIVTRLQSGKASVSGAMAFMDKMASEADASTRSVLYDSFRKQGLTDMEAQIATMESMNFNTRGASPSMHWVNTMVPFFNSAIQGYNVMYKAFAGKMPYAKKLDLQNKLIKRGSMIAGMSILYAIANQDNDAYKNATPDQKYLNWFVPGFGKDGKEAFRLPIPFEAGYIFKAMPEALVNMAYQDDAAKEGLDAIKTVLQQTNPLGVPTAIKAPIELAMNRSLYTGRDIESKRLQALEPGQRFYDTTSEPAKMLGDMLNISPAKLDYLARSYFGGLFTTVASVVNPMLADSSNVKPDGTMSDLPVFGQMFQPEDAGGITQRAYEVLQKASQANATYKHLAEIGDTKGAEEYLKKRGAEEIGLGASAESMRAQLDKLSSAIRTVKEQKLPPGMSAQQFAVQKRNQLTQLQQARAQLAQDFTRAVAETKRQSSR